ncbi:MAG TPA: phosphoribosyltransferase family protein [Acidimicrobiales bacterium]|nr:phosphoribosyltransferase family protein [Acidimicrobiales bacterium]
MDETLEVSAPDGVSGLVVLFDYRGPDRELVLGLKHNRSVGAVPALADRLAAAVRVETWAEDPEMVTWVPTTRARRSERGYDQSLLLAKAVARRLRLPCRRLLQRRGHAQEGLGGAARRAGPELSARRLVAVPVLLIDDVVTTGATLASAAAALRSVGASEVYAAALAVSRAPASL